ncbi:pyridoxine 5'-phosphate synthase [Sulfurihydrogenibium azorense]|jgi:pyridoxine 5-phosphate synthase|uniref:Pyridoxine 5'-phosphate synthase n=1 Tax=Sulfurihydrogenibium azorense (strain DSM 15241 / OCM 825 / Az-Fu1) TaxID=204536 RepID=C1DXD9_SULAA|nr:pyridoxine 5'-phosphate synthase [Sulfurihydrogenibium azorense]ACN98648.1 pyridoxine 5'-phosphate synthase [Sulfurihydrogenibium azorense Az-Fu1]MDM7273987.1 pyridoxine 5'-phosphate synthase [Sulfurihydrogenibium azorense]
MRLGVNIDHIATLREARKTVEPDPVKGALIAIQAGADQITLHLREDRRHIQDEDLLRLKCELKDSTIPINLEMAPTQEMKQIALETLPNTCTLVPEKRQEITTEGGLDVVSLKDYLKDYIKELKQAGIHVSLFIDPDLDQIDAALEVGCDAIEIHTGEYANACGKSVEKELERIKKAAKYAKEKGLKVYAGHGLNYDNVKEIAKIKEIEELNIGHSIIANAVFLGLYEAVRRMKEIIKKSREEF